MILTIDGWEAAGRCSVCINKLKPNFWPALFYSSGKQVCFKHKGPEAESLDTLWEFPPFDAYLADLETLIKRCKYLQASGRPWGITYQWALAGLKHQALSLNQKYSHEIRSLKTSKVRFLKQNGTHPLDDPDSKQDQKRKEVKEFNRQASAVNDLIPAKFKERNEELGRLFSWSAGKIKTLSSLIDVQLRALADLKALDSNNLQDKVKALERSNEEKTVLLLKKDRDVIKA